MKDIVARTMCSRRCALEQAEYPGVVVDDSLVAGGRARAAPAARAEREHAQLWPTTTCTLIIHTSATSNTTNTETTLSSEQTIR